MMTTRKTRRIHTEEKKFRSVIQKIVQLPLAILTVVTIVTIASCVFSYTNMEQTMVENNLNAIQVALNQLDNILEKSNNSFIQYITNAQSYAYMRDMDESTPTDRYLIYQAETMKWLSDEAASYREVEGAFAYYENMDLAMFRGKSNVEVHTYLKSQFATLDEVNEKSRIVEINGVKYLISLNHYGELYHGCWLPLTNLAEELGLEANNLLGQVYFSDSNNKNTIKNDQMNAYIESNGRETKKVFNVASTYQNHIVTTGEKDVFIGILIPWTSILSNIPLVNKIIFIIAIGTILFIPVILYWLQTKIATPMRAMDLAMLAVGNGDMEYRISIREKKYNDEFDRMYLRFNQMVEELNELEFNLYKTKIKEQKTELKYISQQIRPHFILNALNIIYTYEEEEFELVKKMVLYLTDYFRYIVNLKVDFVEVQQEFRHAENYLKIQKERYLERFEYFVEWENQVKDCMIPPLMIQTFVENCVKYAMKNHEVLFIYVLAGISEGRLKIMIADTGNGFTQETIGKIKKFIETREPQPALGMGIQNAIERMDMLYDGKVEVRVRNALSKGAVVEIYLPVELL